ncbi:uncharacterized protein LOC112534591 [Ricinus communis]|uniref:uncharacterized protein LOC112534591 n=1 Tax=Ricinus communis TaxID=3988 RepID=UPI000D696BAC|nr:uncharacterized protein LOC112534591 [Ricinus communis]|eukprot:XP_025012810.1 uncharacterized protein LOC112534591 [Ricinus communis]
MTGESKKSVYTLSSNDNPSNIITQVQLKEDNYDEWARSIRTALRAKKKFGFVDGTVTEPDEDDESLEDWWTVNSMIVSWIMNTISPIVRSILTHLEIAKDLWDDIKDCFSQLWEELANFDVISPCKCRGCKCNIAAELTKKREEEKLHQFLIGLDDVYGTVRSNILSSTLLSGVSKAYSLMCQEERIRNVSKGKEIKSETVSFMVQTKDKSVVCTHCNREGHDAEGCFQLIGYPDWWGDRPKTSSRGRKNGGRGRGKFAGRGRAGVRVNATHAIGQFVAETKNPATPGDLTSEQWAAVLSLLNSCKPGTDEKMTGNSCNLINLKRILGCPIGLPNGNQVLALQEGTLRMGNPGLYCNLIYVSQLVDDLKCDVLFTNELCLIHDRTSKTVIGAGERCKGLYYFKKELSAQAHQARLMNSYDLWHRRMGHPSSKIVGLILGIKNNLGFIQIVILVSKLNKLEKYFVLVGI